MNILQLPPSGRVCDGKVKDIYKSKELWRGPESIYTLKHGLCVAHDRVLG